jgi:hypothetical protein
MFYMNFRFASSRLISSRQLGLNARYVCFSQLAVRTEYKCMCMLSQDSKTKFLGNTS